MKRYLPALFVCLSLYQISCNGGHFSKGFKKDLKTGLSYEYKGLAVADVFLTDGNSRIASNKVPMGSKVVVATSGLDYFTLKDGKVFPGCSMKVTDQTGKTVLNIPDLLAQYADGVTPTDAKTVSATFTTGNPMIKGATYHLNVDIFDKLNKDQYLKAQVDLVTE